MPNTEKIRNIVYVPARIVHAVGLIAWAASWYLNPFIEKQLNYAILAYISLTIFSSSMAYITSNTTTWRISGVFYVLFLSLLYSEEVSRMEQNKAMWGILITALIITGMSVFFIKFIDYAISTILVWTVMWDVSFLEIDPHHYNLCAIYILASTSIGACLNIMVTTSLLKLIKFAEDFRTLSETDPLTGAKNRRALMNFLSAEKSAAQKKCLWFVMVDIDFFKRINDFYGHDTGDKVLIDFTKKLEKHSDIIFFGRLGGEEFGLIINSVDLTAVIRLINSILESVKSDNTINYSFSAGLTNISADKSIDAILSESDKNLYNAKNSGRSCTSFQGVIYRASYIQ